MHRYLLPTSQGIATCLVESQIIKTTPERQLGGMTTNRKEMGNLTEIKLVRPIQFSFLAA